MTCIFVKNLKTIQFNTPFELVKKLRIAEYPELISNGQCMAHFAKELNIEINTQNERLFLHDLEKLGLVQIKMSFFERYLKKPSII